MFNGSHGTTYDNEEKRASGFYDVALSKLGKKQAEALGERYRSIMLHAIFCSDLKRSFETASIAFNKLSIPVIKDARLRECDYGDLTRHPSDEVDKEKLMHISKPFPHGESYIMTNVRMKSFLEDIVKIYQEKTILIIGHRATQYGLESLINKRSLKEVIAEKWQWQPGWEYMLQTL